MNLPFLLPDWMPGWVFLLLALPVLLWVLAFLLVPFSVFGVKARLESLEAQLDSLQEDLRIMGMRASGVLPPSSTLNPYEEVPDFGALKKNRRSYAEPEPEPHVVPRAAPIPVPQPVRPMARERLAPAPPPPPPPRPRRTEPRLD